MQATIANARVDTWVLAAFLVVVLLGGTNFVAVRFSNQELPPFWGAVLLLVLSAVVGEPRAVPTRAPTWMALGYLVLLGSSAGFVLYLYVLRRWSASAVANQFVLFPLVAIALAAWLEGAPVTGSLLLGAGIVLAGVYVGVISQPASRRPCPRMGSEPCMGVVE